MPRVAVIGSGIIGLLTAHGLRRAGCAVTLYSDRTGAKWLSDSRPTGGAGRFHTALSFDRELGLAHWDDAPASVQGVSLALCARLRNRLTSLTARLEHPGRAVDVRMMSERWMRDLEARGGQVVIENVSVPRLDEIAGENDLTIVAAGRMELCQLFPRHAARSVYDAPQRRLGMVIVRGPADGFDGVPFVPVRFNIVVPAGEAFWVPFLHKDHGPTWCLLFEAKPKGPMDRFDGARSGEEVVAIAGEVMRDLIPWDAAWASNMTLADPNGWLVGGVTPTVRDPVGRLPSGRVVTAIGDTIISLDPIGGQGANNGTKMARHMVEAVVARGDRPFDAAWMSDTFERYWEDQGRHIVGFNNLLLEPMSSSGQLVLLSAYGCTGDADSPQQRIADLFANNFDNPRLWTQAFAEKGKALELLAAAGAPHPWSLLRGLAGVARGQLRQAIGQSPGHPGGTRGPGFD